MADLAFMAAQQWAQAHAIRRADPVEFGADVARVYLSAQSVAHHAGDERATAAALAALSIPAEVWQSLAQLSSLGRSIQAQTTATGLDSAGAGS